MRDLQGPGRDQALADLRRILTESLVVVLTNRRTPEADVLAEDFAQEALLKILDGLGTFRGASRFTTWARTIAVRIAFTELRRLRWQDVSLQDLLSSTGREGPSAVATESVSSPDRAVQERNMKDLLDEVMQQELTERQRIAILAVMIHEMPLEEVARRLGTNRNALYKLLHDARVRLKRALEARGLTLEEMLAG